MERHALELARHLGRRGHTVDVYTTFWNDGRRVDEYEGVRIHRASDLSNAVGRYGSLFDLHYFTWGWNLLRYADSLKECDVVQALAPISSSRRLSSLGLPIITQFYHNETILKASEILFKPFHQWIEIHTYRDSSLIVTPSKSSAEDLHRRCRVPLGRIRIVPLAVDPSQYSSTSERDSSKLIRILFVGPHEPRKGLANLIEAMARLRRADANAALTTVGRGPMMKELKELAVRLGISDSVDFMGYVHPDSGQLPLIYREADIFAFPSSLEGFGLVLLEAMASGLPIVASDASAIPEVVGDSGILVPPGDVDALANALESLISNPSLRKELGERGRRRVESRYSWQRVLPQVVEVYEEAIELSGGGRS